MVGGASCCGGQITAEEEMSDWTFEDEVNSFSYYTQQLADLWPQKLALSGCFSGLCAFFYADSVLLWLWLGSLIGDFASGVALALHTDKHLSYDKLRSGVTKIAVYLIYILIAAVAGVTINRASGFEIPFLNLFVAYMTLTELRSILHNMEAYGFKTPLLISAMLKRSTKKIENVVNGEQHDHRPQHHDEDAVR